MQNPSPTSSAAASLKSSGGGRGSLKPTLEGARTATTAAALDALVAAGGPRVAKAALSNPKIGLRTLAGIAARCVPGPGSPFITAVAALESILARGALESALRMQRGVLQTAVWYFVLQSRRGTAADAGLLRVVWRHLREDMGKPEAGFFLALPELPRDVLLDAAGRCAPRDCSAVCGHPSADLEIRRKALASAVRILSAGFIVSRPDSWRAHESIYIAEHDDAGPWMLEAILLHGGRPDASGTCCLRLEAAGRPAPIGAFLDMDALHRAACAEILERTYRNRPAARVFLEPFFPVLAVDEDPNVRLVAAAHAKLPVSYGLALAGDPDAKVRRQLAQDTKSARILAVLARDPDEGVMEAAARNPRLPRVQVLRLARLGSRGVVSALTGRRERRSADLGPQMALNLEPRVRAMAVYMSDVGTRLVDLAALAFDSDATVQIAARSKIADLGPRSAHEWLEIASSLPEAHGARIGELRAEAEAVEQRRHRRSAVPPFRRF